VSNTDLLEAGQSKSKIASRAQLRNVIAGLARGNMFHTLCECLYWAQHATHEKNGRPFIYKSGVELSNAFPIAARTANKHLKTLAEQGYWKIHYLSPPRGVSKVTWLEFSDQSLALINRALEISSRNPKVNKKATFDGHTKTHPEVDGKDIQTSQNVTSNHSNSSVSTSKMTGFILSAGKNEPLPEKKISQGGKKLKPPSYVPCTPDAVNMANLFAATYEEHNLPSWDWVSKHTWLHVQELSLKLHKRKIVTEEELRRFIGTVLKEWSWLRLSMDDRYAFHKTNGKAPSPLAFNASFNLLADKVMEKWKQLEGSSAKENGAAPSNLDEPF
jgi:hypothetical protein